FPCVTLQVVGKDRGRRLRRLSIESDGAEVVYRVATSGKVNLLISIRTAGGNSISRNARVRRQFAPLDLLWIFMVNLSDPAFIGSNELSAFCAGILLSPVHVDYGIVNHRARVSKYRYAGGWCCFHPAICF